MTTAKLTMKDLGSKLETLTAQISALEAEAIKTLQYCATLEARIKELEAKPAPKGRDYGPKSQVKLDDLMAWRIKYGDRSTFAVKDNAEFFGLSRGQVYSLDKYTFQHVNEDSFNEADIPVEVTAE